MHNRDTGVSIFDFLYYLQTTTKLLNETTLDFIRRLKLPDFLLANTNAKQPPPRLNLVWTTTRLRANLIRLVTRPSGFASIRITREQGWRDEEKCWKKSNHTRVAAACWAWEKGPEKTVTPVYRLWMGSPLSDLIRAANNAKSAGNFLCRKCSETRRLVPAIDDAIAHSKLHTIYTSSQSPESYGSPASLRKYPNCTYKKDDNYLRKSETYSKLKQTKKICSIKSIDSMRFGQLTWLICSNWFDRRAE